MSLTLILLVLLRFVAATAYLWLKIAYERLSKGLTDSQYKVLL